MKKSCRLPDSEHFSLPMAVLLERSAKMRSGILGNITLNRDRKHQSNQNSVPKALVLLEKRVGKILQKVCLALVLILTLHTFFIDAT